MVGVHHAVAFAVLAATFGAAAAGAWTYYRRKEPRGLLTHLLALAQTLLIAQAGLGLLPLSDPHRAADRLRCLYGTLSLLAVLTPWMYAPAERRGRLAWFTGATLVAGALAGRAHLTATRADSSRASTRPCGVLRSSRRSPG